MPSRVAIFAILGLALSRSVFAADPSAPHTPPSWALYGSLGLNISSDPLPGDAFLGVSLRRALGRRFALEAALGPGLPVTTRAKDPAGGTREVDLGSGLHGLALLHVQQDLTRSGRFRCLSVQVPRSSPGTCSGRCRWRAPSWGPVALRRPRGVQRVDRLRVGTPDLA
jgi:hypothetical protein